ncbi:hypothetical protein O5560_28470, partial [Escherichia coli]|nr:hypothetical protein [Escherichia coli]
RAIVKHGNFALLTPDGQLGIEASNINPKGKLSAMFLFTSNVSTVLARVVAAGGSGIRSDGNSGASGTYSGAGARV